MSHDRPPTVRTRLARLPRALLKVPIRAYQLILRPWIGQHCRHMPTCSDYALDAIETNGAWKGGWATLGRLSRCRPLGTHGWDPAPDFTGVTYSLPWRYGVWTRRGLARRRRETGSTGTGR